MRACRKAQEAEHMWPLKWDHQGNSWRGLWEAVDLDSYCPVGLCPSVWWSCWSARSAVWKMNIPVFSHSSFGQRHILLAFLLTYSKVEQRVIRNLLADQLLWRGSLMIKEQCSSEGDVRWMAAGGGMAIATPALSEWQFAVVCFIIMFERFLDFSRDINSP